MDIKELKLKVKEIYLPDFKNKVHVAILAGSVASGLLMLNPFLPIFLYGIGMGLLHYINNKVDD